MRWDHTEDTRNVPFLNSTASVDEPLLPDFEASWSTDRHRLLRILIFAAIFGPVIGVPGVASLRVSAKRAYTFPKHLFLLFSFNGWHNSLEVLRRSRSVCVASSVHFTIVFFAAEGELVPASFTLRWRLRRLAKPPEAPLRVLSERGGAEGLGVSGGPAVPGVSCGVAEGGGSGGRREAG